MPRSQFQGVTPVGEAGSGLAPSGKSPVITNLSGGTTQSGEFVPLAGRLFKISVGSGGVVQLKCYSNEVGDWLNATPITYTGPISQQMVSGVAGDRFRLDLVSGSCIVGFAQ